MKKFLNKKLNILITIFFVILFSFTNFFVNKTVFAEDISYTTALQDLHKDSSFSESYYTSNTDYADYSVNLISLAESKNDELFIYTYQPYPSMCTNPPKAITIRLWDDNFETDNDGLKVKDFDLTYLNNQGAFYKYKIKNLKASPLKERSYEIVQIERPWSLDYGDEEVGGDNTISTVPFNVGKKFTFDLATLTVDDIETIKIENKFVGFCRYHNSHFFADIFSSDCDSHFVAFSTDKPIDKLFEVQLCYTSQSVVRTGITQHITYGNEVYHNEIFDYTQHNSWVDKGWFSSNTVSWNIIETVDSFIENEDFSYCRLNVGLATFDSNSSLTENAKTELRKCDWVVRFYKSNYSFTYKDGIVGYSTERYTRVKDVSILRLKFETDGTTYNLGVVDNHQTGSLQPVNVQSSSVSVTKEGRLILFLILLLIFVILFGPILPYIFKIIFWILSLPIKLFKALFKSSKKAVENGKKLKKKKKRGKK